MVGLVSEDRLPYAQLQSRRGRKFKVVEEKVAKMLGNVIYFYILEQCGPPATRIAAPGELGIHFVTD